ncbi:hypothetical protein [Staphylococcus hyicus]|uniref:hypothetical protein n=1 Tax=Staphylococcus hyicus TaxID=1284 RepID=UPI00208E6898|nr:hypothetical protein [Staphylococcus hyicus]HDZ8713637.1 hypothetical protein [Staphylococcus aureus]MCO4330170.1 hypothetical protein [Staphylococcus hyicus]MCO4332793.1 hypothetical protein [Staphylococcus hyicus]MCO4335171.1 hypothetical protein [Staphylococcus hyicus]MCO4337432.1 hypothetical protein [Staphylococcus hyicus]
MNSRKHKLFLFLIAFVVLFSFTFLENFSKDAHGEQTVPDDLSMYSEKDLTKVFDAIEKIPPEVVNKGEGATKSWLENYYGKPIYIPKERIIQPRGIVGCASAIGAALASNIFAPAKILKIKHAIKAGGGAKTFAKTLVDSYKKYRKRGVKKSDAVKRAVRYAGRKSGPEIQNALLGFFGLGAIYGTCFE